MNIAIVGGGKRCQKLLDVIETHEFQKINPVILAVADKKDDAPGILKARETGIFTTHDYNVFFDRDDIDLIVELTGNDDIYDDILLKKKKSVHAIDYSVAMLFWEIYFISGMRNQIEQDLIEKTVVLDMLMNDLIREDVMIISTDYRIRSINNKMLTQLGLRREEAVGHLCHEITHHRSTPCSGENHICPLVRSIETRKPSQATHVHLDKDKNEIYYSISCYPIFKHGKVTGAIELSRDITKDIQMQKMMMQQEKLVSIGRLSAGVAHEINNPLTTVLTTAMLLQEDIPSDDPICEDMELIVTEVLRCRKIVTSLLDFARQTKPEKKLNDINDIVMESILLTRKQAAFDDISVEPVLFDDIPKSYLDKDQIQQALINLLINATEATPSGGKIKVSTSFLSKKKTIVISLSDTGEGIEKERVDKIFDPFFTTKETGTGLGLSITHGIIEQHGGGIDVASQSGVGTTFKINLPLISGKDQ